MSSAKDGHRCDERRDQVDRSKRWRLTEAAWKRRASRRLENVCKLVLHCGRHAACVKTLEYSVCFFSGRHGQTLSSGLCATHVQSFLCVCSQHCIIAVHLGLHIFQPVSLHMLSQCISLMSPSRAPRTSARCVSLPTPSPPPVVRRKTQPLHYHLIVFARSKF